MKAMLQEFRDFINRGNLVDLALAVVLATFFAPIITAIVDGIVMNLIAAIFGQPNFDSIRLKIREGDPDTVVTNPDTGLPQDPDTYLEFGQVINATVTFVIVAFVCFLIVKAYNRMRAEDEDSGPSEVDLLTEIRDELRVRNG